MCRLLLLCFIVAASVSADPVRAAIFRVGTDAACTHTTLQAAIDAAFLTEEGDDIRIGGGPWTVPTLRIIGLTESQGQLALSGGYASCASAQPTPGERTKLEPAPAASPVLNILGSHSVVLRHLEIGGGSGRGVDFRNGAVPAVLQLESVTVIGNGDGGIQLSNTNFPATAQDQVRLTLNGESSVYYNAAAQGGGINCLNATLEVRDGSEVVANYASDHGGGIYADGCQVTVMSAKLSGNVSATRGGGLYLTGANAYADFYLDRPAQPVTISNNRAQRGGAIALAGDARVRLFDAVVSQNRALIEGGAFWLAPGAAGGAGTRLEMQGAGDSHTNCLRAEDCNRAVDNEAWDSDAVPAQQRKPGALVAFAPAIEGLARAVFSGTRVERNRGLSLSQQAERSEVFVNGGLIVSNDLDARLFSAGVVVGALNLTASTVTDNEFIEPGGQVFASAGACNSGTANVRVERSIVWQPGDSAFPDELGALDPSCFRYLIASDVAGLPSSPERLTDDPEFLDRAAGDFRLAATSPGLDFAPATNTDVTRNGDPRVFDLPGIDKHFGPQDLGAYEKAVEYTVAGRVNSGKGSISPESQAVAHNARASLVVAPDLGWRTDWPLSGTCPPGHQVDTTTWRTAPITADCRVEVRFKYAASLLALESTPSASVWGQSVSFSVHLDAFQPASVVEFEDGTEPLGVAAVDAQGVARLTVAGLTPGDHVIRAIWRGDGNNLTPTPMSIVHTVNRAETRTSLIPVSTRFGEQTVVHASVAVLAPGAGTPTGTITVTSPATTQSCSIVLPATSCVLDTASRHGLYTLRAQYSSDTRHHGSFDLQTLSITPQFVGGTVSGLDSAGLVLRLEVDGLQRNARNIAPASSVFRFDSDSEALPVGASYAISVSNQPPGRTCRVDQASGTMPPADVANVSVVCSVNTYPVTLTASEGGSVVVTDPPGSDLSRVPHGTRLTLVATPQPGYRLSELTGCGGAPVDVSPYLTAAITAQCEVNVVFVQSGAPRVNVGVSVNNGRELSLPGDAVVYEIRVGNGSGIAVNGLSLTATLPTALAGAHWSCDATSTAYCTPATGSGNLVMSLNMPPSSSALVRLSGTLGTFQNSVSLTADLTVPANYEDSNYANNSATDTDAFNTVPVFGNGFEEP